MEEGLRSRTSGDGFVTVKVRDVGLAAEGFNADGAADGQGEAVDLMVGELTSDRIKGLALEFRRWSCRPCSNTISRGQHVHTTPLRSWRSSKPSSEFHR